MAAPPVPEKIRRKILKRDGFKCVFCNFSTLQGQTILEVAHIKPRAKPGYGGNEEENLISLCPNCHTLMDRLECICIDPETYEIVVKSGFEVFFGNFSGPECRSYLRNRLSIGSLKFRFSMVMD